MNPEIKNKTEKPNYAARRFGAAILLVLTIMGGIKSVEVVGSGIVKGVKEMKNPYKYSAETKGWIAESEDGLFDAAADVNQKGGSNEYDKRLIADHIADMPENKSTLADDLQVGEILEIPVSVEKNR